MTEINLTQSRYKTLSRQTLFSDLAGAASSSSWDGEESEKSFGESHRPYAGYRRTNSFDRFPFMSRPMRSASRPSSAVHTMRGVQSLTNPNVLFCTPEDIRRATLSRY